MDPSRPSKRKWDQPAPGDDGPTPKAAKTDDSRTASEAAAAAAAIAAKIFMEKHALAILTEAESWNWPPVSRIQTSGNQGGKFKAMTPKLLHGFIAESQQLGGTVLDQFWDTVGKCHPLLRENVKNLEQTQFSTPNHSESILFEGLDRNTIDFRPIFEMAAELFTHLCIAFMNPGGRGSGRGTPFSVSEMIDMDTDKLLSAAASQGFGIRKQTALKALLFKRDGFSCPLTGARFADDGVDPILALVIPNSVHGKPDTIKCIAMFAGTAVRDLVLQQLNDLGNLMNLESNTHTAYDNIKWAIESRDTNGEIEYIYRKVPHSTGNGPGYIKFCDGDRITFGRGLEAARLGSGPHPLLCNLQLAVARVLKMSGAAEVIAQIMEDGDDSDFPQVYIASPAFCNILTAKLLVSGRTLS